MGLLDSLKKQADAVREQERAQAVQRQEVLREVESAMNLAFGYLNDLLKQLAVLKPPSPVVFSIPNIVELRDLKLAETFIDRRSERIGDRDVVARIPMLLTWKSDDAVTVERDMPNTIDKVQSELWRYNLKFELNEVRDSHRKLVKGVFRIEPRVVTDVEIVARHDAGFIDFVARNLQRLGPDEFRVPAGAVNERMLEEFAKTLLGQPSEMRQYR